MQHALVEALRARAINVLTALDAQMIERPDEEHLEFAAAKGRVLYSFNVGDFYKLHTDFLAEGRRHAGIVVARQQQYSVGDQMRRLLKLITTRSAAEMENRIEFLGSWR